jgi:C3HC4-type zinc finger (RING finger) protein/inhibitor of apoptosis domain-containing protein
MLEVENPKKFEYARFGFYSCTYLKVFVCFSCHFSVPIEFNGNIHEHHVSNSGSCAFIEGRDVSINDVSNIPEFDLVQVLGITHFQNRDYFYRKLTAEETAILSPKHLQIGGYVLNSKEFKQKFSLRAFYSPVFVPKIPDRSRFLHVEFFFLLMRQEVRRLATFQLKVYGFPASLTLAEKFAEKGFFYCLLNLTIQCAFCRVVISNVTSIDNIDRVHKIVSTECKFAKGEECYNIKKVVPKISDSLTEISELQCKICLQNELKIVFDCGHIVCCHSCSEKVVNCPTCRKPIKNKKQIYLG